MRRLSLIVTLITALGLAGAGSAQAVVVDVNAIGQTTVPFQAGNTQGRFGVSLVPGTSGNLLSAKVPVVTTPAPCPDPWLTADLAPFNAPHTLPDSALCWHAGGAVIHSNEAFAVTWDPLRRYWATTRNYVERFLRDVADSSGTLTTPYALTTQYNDPGGRAGNQSSYGGGCVDLGVSGGATCTFPQGVASGTGADYPANGCAPTGTNQFHLTANGLQSVPNDVCLTDAQLAQELASQLHQMGVATRVKPGATPLLVLLTPPGVDVCLDAAGTLCSANASSPAQFCSYHSQITIDGVQFAYVVQPWTALTGCDEPDATPIPPNPPIDVLANAVGNRLVSPISQASIAAIVNPWLNGWFAEDGSEMNDNGSRLSGGAVPGGQCEPLPNHLDQVTVGSNGYLLQREFNNGGTIVSDPNALPCAPWVNLAATFVVPSAINAGDVVAFDGSTSVSTLVVPQAGYEWDFGDGSAGVGPSVEHAYGAGGTYTVKLTITDRGGNTSTLSQTIQVLTKDGHVVTPPSGGGGSAGGGTAGHGTSGGGSSGGGVHTTPGLHVKLQLVPQGLRAVLRRGLAVRVSSNRPADGFATLTIPRRAARRAHIRSGHRATVVVGRGTVAGIAAGTVTLHLRLAPAMARRLMRLHHLELAVRLVLFASAHNQLAIDAAGRY